MTIKIDEYEGRNEADSCDFLRERGIEVTPYLLRRWRQIRHLDGPRYFKIGKRVYYREADLVAWSYTLFSLRYRSRWPDPFKPDQQAA